MVDIKDPNTNKVESLHFTAKTNANTANNNSDMNKQTNDTPKELDDANDSYGNMIFPI